MPSPRLMKSAIKFGIKVTLFGACIRYSRDAGVWGDSDRTYKLAQEVIKYSKTDLQSALNQLQFPYPKVQELPTIADMNRSAANCWNKGVIKFVDFSVHLPCMMKKYASEGTAYVMKELQKDPSSTQPSKSNQSS